MKKEYQFIIKHFSQKFSIFREERVPKKWKRDQIKYVSERSKYLQEAIDSYFELHTQAEIMEAQENLMDPSQEIEQITGNIQQDPNQKTSGKENSDTPQKKENLFTLLKKKELSQLKETIKRRLVQVMRINQRERSSTIETKPMENHKIQNILNPEHKNEDTEETNLDKEEEIELVKYSANFKNLMKEGQDRFSYLKKTGILDKIKAKTIELLSRVDDSESISKYKRFLISCLTTHNYLFHHVIERLRDETDNKVKVCLSNFCHMYFCSKSQIRPSLGSVMGTYRWNGNNDDMLDKTLQYFNFFSNVLIEDVAYLFDLMFDNMAFRKRIMEVKQNSRVIEFKKMQTPALMNDLFQGDLPFVPKNDEEVLAFIHYELIKSIIYGNKVGDTQDYHLKMREVFKIIAESEGFEYKELETLKGSVGQSNLFNSI